MSDTNLERESGLEVGDLNDDAAALRFVVACMGATEDLYLRGDVGAITPSTTLRDELGIDSIGRVSLFYTVLDTLEVDAEDDAAAALETVGDLIALVRELSQ